METDEAEAEGADDDVDPPGARDGGAGRVDASSDAEAELGADAGLAVTGRPNGVALCYSAESSNHPAARAFWQALGRGDLDGREAMLKMLRDARMERPHEEEFALLLGLGSLWRAAEPGLAELLNPAGLLDAVTLAEDALTDAYALCPTDHRIPAWLGPIKVRSGRIMSDPQRVADGLAVLDQGIEHYPGFVLFSKFLVYADLPASDPEFMKAVDAVRENVKYCGTIETGLSADPACQNHPHAAHNLEGSSVFMGDMYAKAQDRTAALAAYESAKSVPEFARWPYRALLLERIESLDARLAAAKTPSELDDHESAWASSLQCALCHREQQ